MLSETGQPSICIIVCLGFQTTYTILLWGKVQIHSTEEVKKMVKQQSQEEKGRRKTGRQWCNGRQPWNPSLFFFYHFQEFQAEHFTLLSILISCWVQEFCASVVFYTPLAQVLAGQFHRLKRVAQGLCASSSWLRIPVSRAGERNMLKVIYWSAL